MQYLRQRSKCAFAGGDNRVEITEWRVEMSHDNSLFFSLLFCSDFKRVALGALVKGAVSVSWLRDSSPYFTFVNYFNTKAKGTAKNPSVTAAKLQCHLPLTREAKVLLIVLLNVLEKINLPLTREVNSYLKVICGFSVSNRQTNANEQFCCDLTTPLSTLSSNPLCGTVLRHKFQRLCCCR